MPGYDPSLEDFAKLEMTRGSQLDDLTAAFGQMIDAMPDLVGIADRNGRFRRINLAWTERLGYSTGDMNEISFAELFHPDDAADALRSLETPEASSIRELRIRRKDGSLRRVEWWAIAVPERSEVITFARDIELRKALEAQLAEVEEKFEDLIENADDAICTADLDGCMTSVNRAAERLCGCVRSEILGRPFSDFVPREFHETLKKMTQLKMSGRRSTVFEVEILDRDGGRIPVELNTWLQVRDGTPIGIQGIARDVRFRRQLAEDLKQRNVELEAANTTIRSLLNQDPLTKLANRRSLEEELERAMSFAKRSLQPLALVLCDVDRFKLVNDTFGHAVGDEVLSAFGGLLGVSCRLEDTAARYGGEEFVLVLPNTPLESAIEFAERLRTRTETLQIPSGAAITASFGVTIMQPGDTPDSLISRADAALYKAKQNGRNQIASA